MPWLFLSVHFENRYFQISLDDDSQVIYFFVFSGVDGTKWSMYHWVDSEVLFGYKDYVFW